MGLAFLGETMGEYDCVRCPNKWGDVPTFFCVGCGRVVCEKCIIGKGVCIQAVCLDCHQPVNN